MSTDTVATPEVEIDEATQSKWAARIRKMIALAENAGTPEEAEQAMARAMEAMERYRIDEAMLGLTQERVDDVIERVDIDFTGIYKTSWMQVAFNVLRPMDLKGFYTDMTWVKPKCIRVSAFGFTNDVKRWEMVMASLQLQCVTAMRAWEKERGWAFGELSSFDKFKERRTFIESFGYGVQSKLYAATRAAKQAVAEERAAASGGTETVEQASTGTELAIRDRRERVSDWFDEHHGKFLGKGRNRSHASGSASAYSAGSAAGRNADTGTTRVGGGRKALER